MTTPLATKYSGFLKRYGYGLDNYSTQTSQDRTDRVSKNESIKSHIAYIYKIKYNRTLNMRDIKNLEREARRGHNITPEEPVIYRKEKQPLNPTFRALKQQHKLTNDGINILNLPKQVFGKHETYNETDNFLATHIVYTEPDRRSSEANQEIEDLQKLLRKYKKKLRNRNHNPNLHKHKILNSNDQFNIFKTRGGELLCKKQDKVLKAYEDQAVKFSTKARSTTAPRPSEPQSFNTSDIIKLKTPRSRADIAKTSYRLYRTATRPCESPYAEKLRTKYQKLFETSLEEPIPLPKIDNISHTFS